MKTNKVLMLVAGVLAVGFGVGAYAGTSSETDAFGKMTLQQVDGKLHDKNFYVFDNNTPDRYAEGHVPGAKWVDPSALAATDLPADKSATLVFYCANTHCGACHQGARAAIKLGYKNVFIMPEGIAGWEKAKLPTEKKS